MNIRLVVTLCVGILIGAFIPSCTKHSEVQGQRQEKTQQWEYKVIMVDASGGGPDKLTKEVNALSDDGWEFAGNLGGFYATFRRVKK